MKPASILKLVGGILLIAFFFALPAPFFADSAQAALAPAAQEAVGVVSAGALNVRSGPGISFSSIAVIYQGQSVTVLGRHATNGWVKIRLLSSQEGWVNSSYLFISVPVANLPILEGVVVVPASPTAIVATGALNVRSGPGVSYGAVAVINQGEHVALLGRNSSGSWLKIETTTGAQGWVNATLVTTNVPIQSLPVSDSVVVIPAVAAVTSAALNVRTGPGTEYGILTVVYQGAAVTLLGRNSSGSWVQVRTTMGVTGWVNASLIQPNVSVSTLPVIGVSPPENTAVVATGALNARSGPGVNYGVIGVLYQGQKVVLLGRASGGIWVQIRTPSGTVGWVNSSYLQSNTPYHTLPIV